MKSLIVGLGKSGVAAYDLLESVGDFVIGYDDDDQIMSTCQRRVDRNPVVLDFDRIVVSPGVSPTHRLYQEAAGQGVEIIGEAELALKFLRQRAVAVTGTNGKTTVTLLITHILNQAGIRATAVGNVGEPLSTYVRGADQGDVAVVELSSFQLETLYARVFDAAVILNITPDHLDRYATMRDYAKAKCRLQQLLKPAAAFIVHDSVVEAFADLLTPPYTTYGVEEAQTIPSSYRLHERENIVAAAWVCERLGVDRETFLKHLGSFKKPAHRIEFVATIDGVDYINDSKGTNIDATMKAVNQMQGSVILIAGGVDKGASYEPWKSCFHGKVKEVIVLGEAAPKITAELASHFLVTPVESLQEAVKHARKRGVAGDTVLLSPGCSSYDMFQDYVHRGEEFKKIILSEGEAT